MDALNNLLDKHDGDIEDAFSEFDSNDDNSIDRGEVLKFLRDNNIGTRIPPTRGSIADAVFEMADTSPRDGLTTEQLQSALDNNPDCGR